MLAVHLILGQLGLPYSGLDTVGCEARLADAFTVIHAVQDGVHHSPGLSPTTYPAMSGFDPRVQDLASDTDELYAMLIHGDLPKIHAAVDQNNAKRLALGIPFFVPPSDFDILCNSLTSAGELARLIHSQVVEGQNPILMNPDHALAIIAAAQQEQTPAPPPPPPANALPGAIRQAPVGDNVPIGMVIIDPTDGSQWKRIVLTTMFGQTAAYQKVA